MLLSELIQEDVIKIGLQAANKWEAIEELVDVLAAAHEIRMNDRATVIEAVNTRERSSSTGLNDGLAVPHGTVDCVRDVIAALGTSGRGVPFESGDGEPARLVILVVIPKAEFSQHVTTLAGVSRLAAGADLRGRILAASSAAEIIEAIRAAEDA